MVIAMWSIYDDISDSSLIGKEIMIYEYNCEHSTTVKSSTG